MLLGNLIWMIWYSTWRNAKLIGNMCMGDPLLNPIPPNPFSVLLNLVLLQLRPKPNLYLHFAVKNNNKAVKIKYFNILSSLRILTLNIKRSRAIKKKISFHHIFSFRCLCNYIFFSESQVLSSSMSRFFWNLNLLNLLPMF